MPRHQENTKNQNSKICKNEKKRRLKEINTVLRFKLKRMKQLKQMNTLQQEQMEIKTLN